MPHGSPRMITGGAVPRPGDSVSINYGLAGEASEESVDVRRGFVLYFSGQRSVYRGGEDAWSFRVYPGGNFRLLEGHEPRCEP